ncbi:MAG TPA: discoidin domain-containing protein [Tepidisphaeraceae bacterium]|nr:discoidin domain-containing protein [Tepidisphaeraceae bacterium]
MLKKLIACAVLALGCARFAFADSPVPAEKGWKLVWSDEFNGTSIDRSKWTFDLGNGYQAPDVNMWISGWGNNEREFYTDRPANAYVKDGFLHIRAVKEAYQGCDYTSARLVTRGLFSKAYGRFEFRAKLPVGQGIWPALWLLPENNSYGIWAASGEIDVLEARGQIPNVILGSLNYGSHWPGNDFTEADFTFPPGQSIAGFHTYALEWEPGVMRWYVDDHLYSIKRHWWSCSKVDASHEGPANPSKSEINPWPAPYDKPFYLIMNLAVGGDFLGDPDATTVFPQEMLVDYVRVYDKVGGYGAAAPQGQDWGIEKPHGAALTSRQPDVALHKPATASTEQPPDHLASDADDGDPATRWCASSGTVPQWWQVDLQKPCNLSGAQITWEMDNRNYQYVVEGSVDGQNWQTLSDQSRTLCVWQTQQLKFQAAGIRYVRVRVVGLEPGSWASIADFKVFAQ